MEQRLSKVEGTIEVLLKNNNTLMKFQESVDESVKKIAETFSEYQRFQVEVELHRQNDQENISRIEKKLDDLTEGFNSQMHTLHGRIRKQKERTQESDANFELFKQSVEINVKNRDKNDLKEKARNAKDSDKWWGFVSGGAMVALGAFFSQFFGE